MNKHKIKLVSNNQNLNQKNRFITIKNFLSEKLNINPAYILLILGIITADQIVKKLIQIYLLPVESIVIIKNILSLTYATNTGAGFSLFSGHNIILAIISLGVIISLIYYFNYFKKTEKIFICLIIAGAFGNLIDRLVNSYVIDFIDVHIWPIFNIADISISIGVIFLLISSFRNTK